MAGDMAGGGAGGLEMRLAAVLLSRASRAEGPNRGGRATATATQESSGRRRWRLRLRLRGEGAVVDV